MAWNPSSSNKEIAFCDCKGYLGLIENATTATNQGMMKSAASFTETAVMGEDDAEISISQLKKETGFMINEEDGHDVFTGVCASAINTMSIDIFFFINAFILMHYRISRYKSHLR